MPSVLGAIKVTEKTGSADGQIRSEGNIGLNEPRSVIGGNHTQVDVRGRRQACMSRGRGLSRKLPTSGSLELIMSTAETGPTTVGEKVTVNVVVGIPRYGTRPGSAHGKN